MSCPWMSGILSCDGESAALACGRKLAADREILRLAGRRLARGFGFTMKSGTHTRNACRTEEHYSCCTRVARNTREPFGMLGNLRLSGGTARNTELRPCGVPATLAGRTAAGRAAARTCVGRGA